MAYEEMASLIRLVSSSSAIIISPSTILSGATNNPLFTPRTRTFDTCSKTCKLAAASAAVVASKIGHSVACHSLAKAEVPGV